MCDRRSQAKTIIKIAFLVIYFISIDRLKFRRTYYWIWCFRFFTYLLLIFVLSYLKCLKTLPLMSNNLILNTCFGDLILRIICSFHFLIFSSRWLQLHPNFILAKKIDFFIYLFFVFDYFLKLIKITILLSFFLSLILIHYFSYYIFNFFSNFF